MEENQTNQNLNQQPVQPVQPQPEQVQQSVQQQAVQNQQQVQQWQVSQWQPQPAQPVEEPTVSMQIQQLLVQQQQYQQQYNQLVDYVKKTPNLPIEQINQIKLQLDQLNALFVEWKQKLEALWYNQVQVNKPTEVKKWAKANFSFKKLAIWCIIVLVLISVWFFITTRSLIKNPDALEWVWLSAGSAKLLLQAFTWLFFWSIGLLVIWVIVWNIYRLITVKNQSKAKYVLGLFLWILWLIAVWALALIVFIRIWRIATEKEVKKYDLVQPFLVWRVERHWVDEYTHPYINDSIIWDENWQNYPLIAPSEMAFDLRYDELIKKMNKDYNNYEIKNVTLSCGNTDKTVLSTYEVDQGSRRRFEWTCLYSDRWKYTYSINVTYYNTISKQTKTITYPWNTLNFTSVASIYKVDATSSSSSKSTTKLSSSNWEFIVWRAPAKVTIDSTQVFRDFWLVWYRTEWDMNGDTQEDRIDQVTFDYSYNVPQVYYVTYKFPELSDYVWYRFPVRVEQNRIPVCELKLEHFTWTNTYQIFTEFTNPADAAKIESYNYTIKNMSTKKNQDFLKNESQTINYDFPEVWNFMVVLDYVTVDWKQWRCESDLIRQRKETFNVQYAILDKDSESSKFKEVCNSKSNTNKWCTQIELSTIPRYYQLQLKSVTPDSNTTQKNAYLNDEALLNMDNIFNFEISNEWTYDLNIVTSDVVRWMEEETKTIRFIAKKPDIVGNVTITTAEPDPAQRVEVSEWFEPLTVIIDASKTEVNVEGDEIIYFTWDFGDGEVKKNQQNWVVAHTYNYDYKRENWIFKPTVKIRTRSGIEKTLNGPVLNVKKWLINVDISSISHPSRQAQVWKEVTFSADFDWLPEKMIWDFGDGSDTISCRWRTCTEITHTFEKVGVFTIKLSLEFDAVQQVDWNMDFKVF